MKKILSTSVIMALLLQASLALAWYKININTGQVVDRGNSFAMYEAVITPTDVPIMYLDPYQMVMNSWNDVWFLQDVAYNYTVPIQYVPIERDCDGIACIYKAVLALLGHDNTVGIIFDLTMHHAYNCFWWDEQRNGHLTLWGIDPQNGRIWLFDKSHECKIFW